VTAEHSVMMAEAGFPIAGISKPRGTKSRPGDFGGGRAMGRPPYTADGITRLLCARAGCGRRAHATWGACADDNVQRPLCPECDVELNAWVLNWFGDPDAEHKLAAYRRRMETNIGRPLDTAKETTR